MFPIQCCSYAIRGIANQFFQPQLVKSTLSGHLNLRFFQTAEGDFSKRFHRFSNKCGRAKETLVLFMGMHKSIWVGRDKVRTTKKKRRFAAMHHVDVGWKIISSY